MSREEADEAGGVSASFIAPGPQDPQTPRPEEQSQCQRTLREVLETHRLLMEGGERVCLLPVTRRLLSASGQLMFRYGDSDEPEGCV